MKCQAVACLWSTSPPQQNVTAAVVFGRPAVALYTGGSDGSIVWWRLDDDQTQKEVWPVAMLCGHAAAIVDLIGCSPAAGGESLLSACRDGVLCLWSRGSGYCRKRRRLPPWSGTPYRISRVPNSPRYACIGCASVESPSYCATSPTVAKEGQNNHAPDMMGSSFAVLIVDSSALTIVRTVFHGNLPLQQLQCLSVIPDSGVGVKESIVLADSNGSVQVVGTIEEPGRGSDVGSGIYKSVSLNNLSSILSEGSYKAGGAFLVSVGLNYLALISNTRCVFRSLITGSIVGEIAAANTPLFEDSDSGVELAGGMFLHDSDEERGDVLFEDDEEVVLQKFILWSTTGAALIYTIRNNTRNLSSHELYFEPMIQVPATLSKNHSSLFYFCKFGSRLLRVETIGPSVSNSSMCMPHITIWSLTELPRGYEDAGKEKDKNMEMPVIKPPGEPNLSSLIGEGCFSFSWIKQGTSIIDLTRHSCVSDSTPVKDFSGSERGNAYRRGSNSLLSNEKIVTSSMVLSDGFYAPYAVVYGFNDGSIEVIWFPNSLTNLNSGGENGTYHNSCVVTKQLFSGHTNSVICLAAHCMVGTSNKHIPRQVLISGSSDCTVCIWDLDTGNLVYTLHHHVAPVRQIILPPSSTDRPWSDCFLSVGEDCCVSLVSLETFRVERMFPGHECYPSVVVWDGIRGYIACLCKNFDYPCNGTIMLYIWDVKTGARDRVINGTASYTMFDHFCSRITVNAMTDNILGGTTSTSSLQLPMIEDANISNLNISTDKKSMNRQVATGKIQLRSSSVADFNNFHPLARNSENAPLQSAKQSTRYYTAGNSSSTQPITQTGNQNKQNPIKSSCPFPGIAALTFDLESIISPCQINNIPLSINYMNANTNRVNLQVKKETLNDSSHDQGAENQSKKELIEEYLIRFSISLLHFWNLDLTLDKLLMEEMNIFKPEGLYIAAGIPGDRGSLTSTFPGLDANLEIWKSSSEFCAMRSLMLVSLAQRLTTLCHSCSTASSALAAFYTRNFAEKIPEIKPPMLQLLVSFWQHTSEHVRMAARSLFHCAAPRAAPHTLCHNKMIRPSSPSIPVHVSGEFSHLNVNVTSGGNSLDSDNNEKFVDSDVAAWLESYEMQDWISCIGGTAQDSMSSHIIVAAALSVWYPSIAKPNLARLVVRHLIKLVMAASDHYSSTAAEVLSDGMDSTWKICIGSEISHLIGDIFFQIECLTGAYANDSKKNHASVTNIRETLIGVLLPSLAMADVHGFLHVIESQLWAMSSDSPVHLVALTTLIRVIRGSPKPLASYLDKAVNFILQTMDPANSVMRKICLQSSMAALREVARVFPMVALNEAFSRLAVGDALGDAHNLTIRVYDLQSLAKIKVLDASGPPGLPTIMSGASASAKGISALAFSPDGEGIVAFSEYGLVIRWWSIGTAWWEKLSRSLVPVQCTKLIFVPPCEGFSPTSSRSSIIANITGHEEGNLQEKMESPDFDSSKTSIHNIDLTYRLDWLEGRRVILTRHGQVLGSFQF